MASRFQELKEKRSFQEFYFLALALMLAFGALQTTGTAMNTDKPVVTVVSCSMYPEYHVGDVLFVKGVQFEDIEVGDVIVYDARGEPIPIVHRVIEKHGDYLETRGDNNRRQLEFEKHVDPKQIHGKVVFTVPRIGGLKILAMDLIGYRGDMPLLVDSYPRCPVRVPLDQRPRY